MIIAVLVVVVQKKCLPKKNFQNKFEYKLLLLEYIIKKLKIRYVKIYKISEF
jgi:hypothetical protein